MGSRGAGSDNAGLPQEACVVLHVDVDAFFVQVEQLRHPHLAGRAVAVQQHGDIIALNAAAKAAGVRKHGNPVEARTILGKVGGTVTHVHVEDGYRISYRPYQEMSKRLIALLDTFPMAAVVEKASIDEFFILCHPVGQGPFSGDVLPLRLGAELGEDIRRAAKLELELEVSIGVARNRFLAKLTANAAKPNGLRVTESPQDVDALLCSNSVDRLPGFGGKVAERLQGHHICTIKDVQSLSQEALATLTQLKPEAVMTLIDLAHGIDGIVPTRREPPKTISLQMTLTPVPLPIHPSWKSSEAAGGGGAGLDGVDTGMLMPLFIQNPDAVPRIKNLLSVMLKDLAERVQHDSCQESRWPGSLGLTVKTQGAGGRTMTRTAHFPVLAGPLQACVIGEEKDQAFCEQVAVLQQDLLAAANLLFQGMLTTSSGNPAVVKVQVAATAFKARGIGPTPVPLTSFFRNPPQSAPTKHTNIRSTSTRPVSPDHGAQDACTFGDCPAAGTRVNSDNVNAGLGNGVRDDWDESSVLVRKRRRSVSQGRDDTDECHVLRVSRNEKRQRALDGRGSGGYLACQNEDLVPCSPENDEDLMGVRSAGGEEVDDQAVSGVSPVRMESISVDIFGLIHAFKDGAVSCSDLNALSMALHRSLE